MPDPVLIAIAGAVAGKTVEGAFAGGRKAYESLAALVKRRFAKEPSAQAALEAAESDPEEHTERLAAALEFISAGDEQFRRELHQEWERLQPTINASEDAVVNSVSGTVEGSVIQVGKLSR